jgi:hypothetical protein
MILTALTLAGLVQAPVDLRWSPATGEKLTYRYTLATVGEADAMSMTVVLDIQVVEAGPAGFTTQATGRDTEITLAGQTIRDIRSSGTRAKFGPRGELQQILTGASDRGALLLNRAIRFIAPPAAVAPGADWTFAFPPYRDAKAMTWSGKFLEVTPQGKARVSMTLEEAPKARGSFSAKGVWLVDGATGRGEEFEGELANMGGFTPNASYRISVKRV